MDPDHPAFEAGRWRLLFPESRRFLMDLGYYMVAAGFVAAVVVFCVGWARQRSTVSSGPPPLPTRDSVEILGLREPSRDEGPYAPPITLERVREVSDRRPGLWQVSSRPFRWIDLPLMAFLVGIYMLPLILEPFGKLSGAGMELGYETILATIATQFFFTALVFGMVVWRVDPVRWLGLRWRQWWLIFAIAPVAVLSTWAFAVGLDTVGFNAWLQSHLDGDGMQEMVKAFSDEKDGLLVALMCFTAVIVAPVSEEIIFRGYLYPVSKRFIGRAPAILFSSLIFAVIHHNAMALLPLCFLAILLVLAYELTGSIWAPIGIHLAFNGATVALQLLMRWEVLPSST